MVGALLGRIRNELNFSIQLQHRKELENYGVKVIRISRKQNGGLPDFEVRKTGRSAALSILDSWMSFTLVALSM